MEKICLKGSFSYNNVFNYLRETHLITVVNINDMRVHCYVTHTDMGKNMNLNPGTSYCDATNHHTTMSLLITKQKHVFKLLIFSAQQ